MKENDFELDISKYDKNDFLKRIGILLKIAIFLMGVSSAARLLGIVADVRQSAWNRIGMADFVWEMILFIIGIIVLGSLIKIVVDKKPFSKTLTWSIHIIGILLVITSLLLPRLNGYHSSGFEILSYKNAVFCDGYILLPGIVLIILGNVIMAGFDMQKEMDDIL